MKHKLQVLDLYFLISLLEGIAALGALFAIPGDQRNAVILGFSAQRLAIIVVLLAGTLAICGLFMVHFFHTGLRHSIDKLFVEKERQILFATTALLGIGLVGSVWLPAMGILSDAVIYRLWPLTIWLGLLGGQGLGVILWSPRKNSEGKVFDGGRWLTICFCLFALLPFLIWFFVDPDNAGLFFRSDLIWVSGGIFATFWMVFNRKGRAWVWLGLGLTLITFIIPLIGIWARGISDPNFLIGLFPYNDAHGYYLGARLFDEGSPMNAFAARRPLFPAFLAFLLGITSQNLQAAVLILVLLAAAGTFLFGTELKRTHGTAAGVLGVLLLFLFYRRFTGSVMTENQGFAMGALGFAVLWRAVADRKEIWLYFGLACLSIALTARAGPFFILPIIGLWAAWFFRSGKIFSWHVLGISALACAVGLVANQMVIKSAGSVSGMPFSNFSYTLYGTVTGGTGWKQVFSDHPEVLDLKEPDFSARIYALAFDEFKRDPMGLVRGSWKAWKSMLSLDFYGMFGFVSGANTIVTQAVRLVLFLLSGLGLIFAVRGWKRGWNSFILAVLIGVWLSIPFVPPLDAEIRTYAAVIPLFAALPVVGVSEIIRYFKKEAHQPGDGTQETQPAVISGWAGAAFALLFSAAAIVGPFFVKGSVSPTSVAAAACPDGEESVVVGIDPGSYVQVVEDADASQTWLPVVRWSDFAKSVHDFPVIQITNELAAVTPPATISFTHDLRDGRHVWLIVDSRLLPETVGTFSVCGSWTENKEVSEFGFFYGKSLQPVGNGIRTDD